MILELNKVTKSFGERNILKNVSLRVNKAETIAITGPSGSGKTTLLNIIGALDKPDSGTIKLNGQSIHNFSNNELAYIRSTQIGFVFQLHYLLPQCTLLENVLIPTLALKDKGKKKEASELALNLLERVGLVNQREQRPGELSGGECQRAAFIRALINKPSIILADEPTGSLDQENATKLGQLLINLNNEMNTTLIVVTHSMELAKKMGVIYYLQNGELK
jgi:ABC-type lipoprotein export system ATPase subunit